MQEGSILDRRHTGHPHISQLEPGLAEALKIEEFMALAVSRPVLSCRPAGSTRESERFSGRPKRRKRRRATAATQDALGMERTGGGFGLVRVVVLEQRFLNQPGGRNVLRPATATQMNEFLPRLGPSLLNPPGSGLPLYCCKISLSPPPRALPLHTNNYWSFCTHLSIWPLPSESYSAQMAASSTVTRSSTFRLCHKMYDCQEVSRHEIVDTRSITRKQCRTSRFRSAILYDMVWCAVTSLASITAGSDQ